MAEIIHQCVAASGTHISLISLQRTRLATIPTTFSHTLVLQSSSTQHQPSHSQTVTNQHILPSNSSRAPPSSLDYLGALAQGFSSTHASCQVAQGNFVFTTGSGSVLVTGLDPLSNTSIKAQWIPPHENTTLSIVFDKDQGLPSTTTSTTTDEPFAQAQVVPLEYTRTSPYGLTIHILRNHLDQTTRALVRALVRTKSSVFYGCLPHQHIETLPNTSIAFLCLPPAVLDRRKQGHRRPATLPNIQPPAIYPRPSSPYPSSFQTSSHHMPATNACSN